MRLIFHAVLRGFFSVTWRKGVRESTGRVVSGVWFTHDHGDDVRMDDVTCEGWSQRMAAGRADDIHMAGWLRGENRKTSRHGAVPCDDDS